MEKFAAMFAKSSLKTFEHGVTQAENLILTYSRPSWQVAAQEEKLCTFIVWG